MSGLCQHFLSFASLIFYFINLLLYFLALTHKCSINIEYFCTRHLDPFLIFTELLFVVYTLHWLNENFVSPSGFSIHFLMLVLFLLIAVWCYFSGSSLHNSQYWCWRHQWRTAFWHSMWLKRHAFSALFIHCVSDCIFLFCYL